MTSVFLGTLFVAVIIIGIIKLAFLQIVWREEEIKNELETSFNSFSPFPNSNTISYDEYVEKDNACIVRGALVFIGMTFSTNSQPDSVFNYYNQELNEQGWSLSSTVLDNYIRANYYHKEGGYSASLVEDLYPKNQQGIYHLETRWDGGMYPCK